MVTDSAPYQIDLPALHSRQREIAASPARFRIVAAGRRWGKSRLAAALAVECALRGGVVWWVAPSYPLARVGWRTLKGLALQVPGVAPREAERLLRFPTGGWVQVRSADDPDSLRGEGLDLAILDECAFMKREAWTEALRPTLADRQGRALFLSTPKGGNWFHALYKRGVPDEPTYDPAYASWNLPTSANPFIRPEEIAAARADLSPRIFRQELEAAFLSAPEGALWQREWLQYGGVPELVRVVVAIDPAGGGDADEVGIVVAGRGVDGRGYVLADRSGRLAADAWAQRAVAAFDEFQADRVVAEANFGGDMVSAVLRTVRRTLPVSLVHASRGKQVRAEPVAALYAQGRVTHSQNMPELDDQLCQWVPGLARSPDRLDALVWALTALLLEAPRKVHAY